MSALTVIPPQPPEPTPRPTNDKWRWKVNVASGVLIVLILVIGGISAYSAFVKKNKKGETPKGVVVYQLGTVDLEPGMQVTYNKKPVGTIDSAFVNVIATQIRVRVDSQQSSPWYVITFTDVSDKPAFVDSLIINYCQQKVSVSRTECNTKLVSIESSGTCVFDPIAETYINGKKNNQGTVVLVSGDYIAFGPPSRRHTLQWNAPAAFTSIFATIDIAALQKETMIRIDSATVINSSASLEMSEMFGLTNTAANFVPTFAPSLVRHEIDQRMFNRETMKTEYSTLTELNGGGGVSLAGLTSAYSYLTDHSQIKRPPTNRLESIINSLDSSLASISGAASDLKSTTVPSVDSTINSVRGQAENLFLNVDDKLAALQTDVSHLSNTADRTISKLGDSTSVGLSGLQLKLDLLIGEIRATTLQIRKTLGTIGNDTHELLK
jgi:hypothetical protein